ncbi:MAG: HAD-IA family hydrolase [Spirochaetes bacterium]|jgi:pyrophosphatase PpaX|nr:HAD-IA family hydrolase [Spirochaetota bacterium]
MSKYKTFLFDADGTLLDTVNLIIKCFEYTLSHYGKPVPERSVIASHIGIPFKKQIIFYFGDISEEMAEEIWNFYREYQLKHYQDYIALFPDTLEVLQQLKSKGAQLGVVTSRSNSTLDLFLKHLNIYDIFDVIITPDDVSRPKPDPEPSVKALRMLNAEAADSLFIGDAIYDQMSAVGAGIDFALVSWTHIPITVFNPEPAVQLQSMNDLLALV